MDFYICPNCKNGICKYDDDCSSCGEMIEKAVFVGMDAIAEEMKNYKTDDILYSNHEDYESFQMKWNGNHVGKLGYMLIRHGWDLWFIQPGLEARKVLQVKLPLTLKNIIDDACRRLVAKLENPYTCYNCWCNTDSQGRCPCQY